MNTNDFLTSAVLRDLWFKSDSFALDANRITGVQGTIQKANRPGCYRFYTAQDSYPLRIRDEAKADDADFNLARGLAHIAEVKNCVEIGELCMAVQFFAGQKVELGNVCISISEEQIRNAAAILGIPANTSGDEKIVRLNERCSLNDGRFLVNFSSDSGAAFCVYAPSCEIDIEEDEKKPLTYRVKEIRARDLLKQDIPFRLCSGALRFVQSSEETSASPLVQSALNKAAENTGSFLQMWDKYCRSEGDSLIKKARRIGVMSIQNVEEEKGNWKLWLDGPVNEELKKDDWVAVYESGNLPQYIEDADMDWAAYQEHEKELMKSGLDATSKPKAAAYKIISTMGNSITVNGRVCPEPGQKLVLSIKGDEAQIIRREKARKAVMGGSSANPLLGFDFDGGKAPEPQSYAMETFRERKEAHT